MDKKRFIALWQRCLRNGADDACDVFEVIERCYGEAHRRYHTPQHIDHCLGQFDLAVDHIHDADAVEMALWFHDVIYDVPVANNELRSAELFKQLSAGRVNESFGTNVYEMIMITTHQDIPVRHDDKYIVDVDLSSFGMPWEECKRDSENVREEFAHKSDRDFFSNHIKFLQSLMDRPTFFSSTFFRERYEENARKNVRRMIEQAKGTCVA